MAIVRRTIADIDVEKLLEDLKNAPEPTEEQIERWAEEDGDAWTDEDFANAVSVRPPHTPEEVRTIRDRLGLTQQEFAHRYGFPLEAIQRFEDGTLVPTGPETTLIRVIDAEPDAVARVVTPLRFCQIA